jgi:hypothetical protein
MTIYLNADFTHRLQTRFDEYTELDRALKLWDLSSIDITRKQEMIEHVGLLKKRMAQCKKENWGCNWRVNPNELVDSISLLDKVAKEMNYTDPYIVEVK